MFSIHTSFLVFHDFIRSIFSIFIASNTIRILEPICLPLTVCDTWTNSRFLWGSLGLKSVESQRCFIFRQRFTLVWHAATFQHGRQNTRPNSKRRSFEVEILAFSMAGFRPRGSIIQFNWQETAEGREFLGGILHRNRRKTFGERFDTVQIACFSCTCSLPSFVCIQNFKKCSFGFASASRTLQNKI